MEDKKIVEKYGKEEILKSDAYKKRADILGVLLEDEKEYSFSEVDKIIDNFMKKGVN